MRYANDDADPHSLGDDAVVSIFQELSRTTDKILCILVSKALTATHESAYLAKRMILIGGTRYAGDSKMAVLSLEPVRMFSPFGLKATQ